MFEAVASAEEKQRKLDGLAFTFCKAATLVVIFQRYALIGIPLLASISYVVAYVRGLRGSRCVLRYPLLIAGLWMAVAIWAGVREWAPELLRSR